MPILEVKHRQMLGQVAPASFQGEVKGERSGPASWRGWLQLPLAPRQLRGSKVLL